MNFRYARQERDRVETRGICVVAAILVWVLLAALPVLRAQGAQGDEHWVGTWATAVVEQAATPTGQQAPAPPAFANQTLRQIVHVSLGGDQVRIVLSNTFGTQPLEVGAAQIAVRAENATIVPASRRALTFGGRLATLIPAGAVVFSDPVRVRVPALADLAIDLYLPGDTAAVGSPLTTHSAASQTSYVSTPGNHAGADELPVMTTIPDWFFLSRVEVLAPETVGAVVILGDSIADGTGSTPDTNNRWPDHLARRLAAANIELGVLNLGIAGNRVLSDGLGVNALARFDRDVLAQSGVTHVIFMEGVNDIGLASNELGLPRSDSPPTAEEIIFGHQQVIARARAQGLKIYGATLTPFEETAIPVVPNYWTAGGDATRQAVNAWLRSGQGYDEIIDFDVVMRSPEAPTRFLPEYDSGDHLHPGDTGYVAMAEAVDLELLKVDTR
jgi:lysophospholipase L1-like esterase